MRRALGAALALACASACVAAPAGAGAATPVQRKLDSHVQALRVERQAGGDLRAAGRREGVPVSAGGRVLVDVYVRGDVSAAAAALRRAGMIVGATADRGAFKVVEGRLPLGAADDAAALTQVKSIVAVPPPELQVGAKTSQGDAAHRAPQARAQGPTGAGVDVGIISDSINRVGAGIAGSQATGDLPPSVTVLSDGPAGSTDEGRAMAEIVFDEAPGIPRILFGSVFNGEGSIGKASLIDQLVANGADVIADDTAFFNDPFFQDGAVAQAVDRATANGTTYFTSAGNQARQSWEGTFNPSASVGPGGGPLNDFDPGAASDRVQSLVTVPNGANIRVFLQWDEPYTNAETNLDLFLTTTGGAILANGLSSNVGGVPFEFVNYTNGTGAAQTVAVAVERKTGTRAPFMKYIATGNFGTFSVAEHPTASDAIAPGAAASKGSVTVGAVSATDSGLDDLEVFSSRGPKTILFDGSGNRLASPEVRQKPEIAAADNVSTTVPGFDPFRGTSAAAPSAAGLAALMKSGRPSLSPGEIRTIMTDSRTTNDCNPAGDPDSDCGFGFVFGDSSQVAALDSSPPVVAPALSPPAPNGANGFYTGDVGVAWSIADPESPVTSTSGCPATTIATDTAGTTLDCAATSFGGAGSGSATIKRDASPPTVPIFTGITAGVFEQALLPPAASVGCAAGDPTSGIDPAGCQVSGYGRALGGHVLAGRARNLAGLEAVGRLAYTVRRTAPAIARLSALRTISLRGFLRRGLPVRVSVARAGTRVVADLVARRVRIARVTRTRRAGRTLLRLRPTARGRRALRGHRRTSMRLTVTGLPRVGGRATLRARISVRAR